MILRSPLAGTSVLLVQIITFTYSHADATSRTQSSVNAVMPAGFGSSNCISANPPCTSNQAGLNVPPCALPCFAYQFDNNNCPKDHLDADCFCSKIVLAAIGNQECLAWPCFLLNDEEATHALKEKGCTRFANGKFPSLLPAATMVHPRRSINPFNTTLTFLETATASQTDIHETPSTPAEESANDFEFGFLGLLPPKAASVTRAGMSLPTLSYYTSFYPNTTSNQGLAAADISTLTLTSTVFAPVTPISQTLAPINSFTGAAIGRGLGCGRFSKFVLGACTAHLWLL